MKLTLKQIADSIQANDFEPSIRDVSKRIDYLNGFLEDRKKHLEEKYMGSEEEYAIGDVINLLELVKNKLNK
jgi:hypothetical protein